MYSVQKPYYLAVCRLERVHEAPLALPSDATSLDRHLSYTRYTFRCNVAAMVIAADMPAATSDTLLVLLI